MTALHDSTFFYKVSSLAETHYEIRNDDCRTMGFAPIAKVSPDKRLCTDDGLEAAERIVAALNACKGVPTHVLSRLSVADLLFGAAISSSSAVRQDTPLRFLSINKVAEMTGLSNATIYRYVNAGIFPKPLDLGSRRVAWREADVLAWMTSRAEKNPGNSHTNRKEA